MNENESDYHFLKLYDFAFYFAYKCNFVLYFTNFKYVYFCLLFVLLFIIEIRKV